MRSLSQRSREISVIYRWFGVVAMLACLGAAAPWEMAHGVVFLVVGVMMALFPPKCRTPWSWGLLAILALAASLGAFAPADWFTAPAWRGTLKAEGLLPFSTWTPQPVESAWSLGVAAVGVLIALWILGHADSEKNLANAAGGWLTGVLAFVIFDLVLRQSGQMQMLATFGFFPNRNHSACLVAMGCIVGWGMFAQSLRHHRPWMGGLSLATLLFLTGNLLVRSESRAGLVLIAMGALLWALILGRDHLRGTLAKAAALTLFAAILAVLVYDFAATNRISKTVERVQSGESLDSLPGAVDRAQSFIPTADARVMLHRDAWRMIADSPWVGWGSGQFVRVFPQYRLNSAELQQSTAVHPESSWLWLMAEHGVPATMLSLILVTWILTRAIRDTRHHGDRSLRAACCAAAMLPFLHGIMDVSANRVGILWSAALLAGIALQGSSLPPSRLGQWFWRLLALAPLGFAWLLLSPDFTQNHPSSRVKLIFDEAMDAYLKDYKNPWVEKTTESPASTDLSAAPVPPATESQDPLPIVIESLKSATRLVPLDPACQGLLGILALHYDEMDDLARKSLHHQELLDPYPPFLPLVHGQLWAPINLTEAEIHWCEAMRRAKHLQTLQPGTLWLQKTHQNLLQRAAQHPEWLEIARKLAPPSENLPKK